MGPTWSATTPAASLPIVKGGRTGSIVELAGGLEPRWIGTSPWMACWSAVAAVLDLAPAVADGSPRRVVDEVLDWQCGGGPRRVESRRGQGKAVLRVAR